MTQLVATLVMIFAPLGELARLWRALIAYVDGLNSILTDESLSEDLDDPHARAWAERYIAMAEDGIAILVAQRTSELLGLPFQRIETRQPAHLPHPRSRERLMARHARMLTSLATIERAAHKRTARIRRERGESPLRLAPSAQSTSPAFGAIHLPRLRRWRASSKRTESSTALRAGEVDRRVFAPRRRGQRCPRAAFKLRLPIAYS